MSLCDARCHASDRTLPPWFFAMKKIIPWFVLFSLVALGGTLFITNPSEEDYAQYLSQTLSEEVKGSLCQPEQFSEWLGKVGEALSKACQGLVAGGESLSQEEIQAIIIENTDYKNRIFFSTYISETPFGNYRAIGLFNRFILREQQES
jgi:hypothetical protein